MANPYKDSVSLGLSTLVDNLFRIRNNHGLWPHGEADDLYTHDPEVDFIKSTSFTNYYAFGANFNSVTSNFFENHMINNSTFDLFVLNQDVEMLCEIKGVDSNLDGVGT